MRHRGDIALLTMMAMTKVIRALQVLALLLAQTRALDGMAMTKVIRPLQVLALLLTQTRALSTIAKPLTTTSSLRAPGLLTTPVESLRSLIGEARTRSVWKALREGRDPCVQEETPELSRWTRETLTAAYGSGADARCADARTAEDGTTKLLVEFGDRDAVEAVLIPQLTRGKATSTLCVSSQVGCAMGCAFCATGKMGLIRSLTDDEIAAQLWLALRTARSVPDLPPLRSIVFMGMGDAGTNPKHAKAAAECFTDPDRFGFSRHRLTLSTVGPSPSAFLALAAAPGQLAWSVHAVDADLRKRLVPTAAWEPEALRDGLLDALRATRPMHSKERSVMLAVTLLAGVNDSLEHARALAEFVQPVRAETPRLIVDLIPYNPIDAADAFQRPSFEAVSAFQRELKAHAPGLFIGVRNARGDDEAAACGQLATNAQKRRSANLKP